MRAFVAWGILGLAMVGTVGCGANIPKVEDIDANPQADKDAMAQSMKNMMDKQAEMAKSRGGSAPKVDVNKQVENTAGN